jgi:hypothetical protein
MGWQVHYQSADHQFRRLGGGGLRATTAPTEPGRGVASINATDSGLKSLSTLRTDIAAPSVGQASTWNAALSSIGKPVQRSESWLTLSATRAYFTWVMLKSLK